MADKPKLFSTFMMWMLAELYHNLPEAGDLPKPKLVFFFDEAHLLFEDAPKAFLDQIEQVVRLIRSKGVGVFFVTQTPKDVPEGVLAQLGNRIQHALRAHTPDDDKALKATVRTFPKTSFYDLEQTLTSLGIGEAVVTVLNARGCRRRSSPPGSFRRPRGWRRSHRRSCRPTSGSPDLLAEYGKAVDRESAREMLAARMAKTAPAVWSRARQPAPRSDRKDHGPGCGWCALLIHDRAYGGAGGGPRDLWPARGQAGQSDDAAEQVVGRLRFEDQPHVVLLSLPKHHVTIVRWAHQFLLPRA